MGLVIKENGKMVDVMVKGKTELKMDVSMKVTFMRAWNMEKENIYIMMVKNILDNLEISFLKDKEHLNLLMAPYMKDNGNIVKCMVKVYWKGQMVKPMKVILLKIKLMDKGRWHSLMVACILVSGKMTKKMEEEFL